MSLDYRKHAETFLESIRIDGEPTIRYTRGTLWEYEGLRYQLASKEVLNDRVMSWMLDFGFSGPGDRHGVVEAIRGLLYREGLTKPPQWAFPRSDEERFHHWLAFRNGILDVTEFLARKRVVLVGHTPRWFSTTILPYNFDPEVTCPVWERCVREWVLGDQPTIDFLQEFCGYCFSPTSDHQYALFLQGQGANGKNIFSETLTRMLGEENVSAVPIEEFGDRFALETTIGMLVNISSETNKKGKLAEGTIKRFISSDRISINKKHKTSVTVKPTTKLIAIWNDQPDIEDSSNAFWRRMRMVRFLRRYEDPSVRDPFLQTKLDRELSGIFNWAIRGLDRLNRAGDFTVSPSIVEANNQVRDTSDPLRAYLLAHYTENPTARVQKDEAYRHYEEWCEDNGREVAVAAQFGKRVKELFPSVRATRLLVGGVKTPVFVGLTRKEESHGGQSVSGHLLGASPRPNVDAAPPAVLLGGHGTSGAHTESGAPVHGTTQERVECGPPLPADGEVDGALQEGGLGASLQPRIPGNEAASPPP